MQNISRFKNTEVSGVFCCSVSTACFFQAIWEKGVVIIHMLNRYANSDYALTQVLLGVDSQPFVT